MPITTRDLRQTLLENDSEFRRLAEEHSRCESQLEQLIKQPYLSVEDLTMEVTLKKTKLRLKDLWKDRDCFRSVRSPLSGESRVHILFRSEDLLWRPVGRLVRFVWIDHPLRGRLLLMTTDLELDPLQVLVLYSYRFRIELSFKQALHTLGTYAYHFWMRAMTLPSSELSLGMATSSRRNLTMGAW